MGWARKFAEKIRQADKAGGIPTGKFEFRHDALDDPQGVRHHHRVDASPQQRAEQCQRREKSHGRHPIQQHCPGELGNLPMDEQDQQR